MSVEHDPKTLHVTSRDFFIGFHQGTLDYELKYKPKATVLNDIEITTFFVQIATGTRSDLWKAGYQAGLFAAIYGIPYIWMIGPVEHDLHYGLYGRRRTP